VYKICKTNTAERRVLCNLQYNARMLRWVAYSAFSGQCGQCGWYDNIAQCERVRILKCLLRQQQ